MALAHIQALRMMTLYYGEIRPSREHMSTWAPGHMGLCSRRSHDLMVCSIGLEVVDCILRCFCICLFFGIVNSRVLLPALILLRPYQVNEKAERLNNLQYIRAALSFQDLGFQVINQRRMDLYDVEISTKGIEFIQCFVF